MASASFVFTTFADASVLVALSVPKGLASFGSVAFKAELELSGCLSPILGGTGEPIFIAVADVPPVSKLVIVGEEVDLPERGCC
uniref:Putative secreted protein n=1 Tax=Anopheles darlingi TaxID=43151 RepID=A0A2M4DHR7_ANODA